MLAAAARDDRPRGLGNGLRAPLRGLLRTKSHIEFSKNYAGFIPILSSISSASLTSNLWLETKKFLAANTCDGPTVVCIPSMVGRCELPCRRAYTTGQTLSPRIFLVQRFTRTLTCTSSALVLHPPFHTQARTSPGQRYCSDALDYGSNYPLHTAELHVCFSSFAGRHSLLCDKSPYQL